MSLRRLLAILVMSVVCASNAPAQSPPATFSRAISTSSQSLTVDFTLYPIRNANFEVVVQQADGTWLPHTPDVARTYLGTVQGRPGATACGLLKSDGTLWARISFEDGTTWTSTGSTASASGTGFVPAWPTTVVSAGGAGPVVYAAEVGFDSTFNHYTACGSTAAGVVEQCEFSVLSANMVYLRDAAILHRIGKILVRADATQDPYTADGGDTGLLLPHVRTLWNAGGPMGSSHDIAAVLHSAAGGGLAYVGTVGTSSRYSADDSDANGDFSVVWRHEVGHNWSSSHYEGGGNPEGSTIMSNNSLSRFSSSELRKIISHRNSKTAILDNLGNFAFPLPPRANQDTASFLRNSPTRVDVLANDSDSNGNSLGILSFDPTSDLGGSLTRSVGTGPGGRDEILYTPPAALASGTDWFQYRIEDSSGMQAVGYAMLRPRSEVLTLLDHWTLDDSSGNTAVNRIRGSQNGTHENGTLAGQSGATAVTRKGAYFDGSNDQTAIPAPGYNTNTLTFTSWIRRNGAQIASSPILFTRAGSSVAGLHFGGSNDLRYTWDATGYAWSSGISVPDNTWCLAAMCVSPTGTTLYLRTPDGLQSATNTATQAAEAFNGILYLGYDSYNSARHFKGWIDDVRTYAATLNAADIESLYQQASAPPAAAVTTPSAGAALSPLNVGFTATVTDPQGLTDRVEFVENESTLGSAEEAPWHAVVSAITPGARTVSARAYFGDWGYSVDSAPVAFTALAAPLPVVTVAASLAASKRGPVPGSFIFTRDHPIGEVTVSFTLTGTAVAGVDYTAIPTSITFSSGSLQQTLTVNPIAAAPDSVSESLILALDSSPSHSLGSQATATLVIDDHITSVADGEWDVNTTWNSGTAAPVSGTQNSGTGYSIAHVVSSNDPNSSNAQALVAGSLRVKSGGVLDLARLHNSTNQNVSYNLPATSVEDGGSIRFRCSNGSSTHTVAAALNLAGNTTLRLNGGNYDNGAVLSGTVSGSGVVQIISDTGASGGTYVRKVSVTKAGNPYSGGWTVSHTGGGNEFAGLRAAASNALGTGTVTVGLRAQLINDNATGLNSLSGAVLSGTDSNLKLNQPWNNTAASLSLTGTGALVELANAASSIGSLSGSSGMIQGVGASSSLSVYQTADREYSGGLGTSLAFVKSGPASLTLAGPLDSGLRLTLAQGTLSLGTAPDTIASLNQTGGTLVAGLSTPASPAIVLTGDLARTGGVMLVYPPASPQIGVPYTLIAYQGTRSGQSPVVFSSPVDALVDYGSGSNSAITVTFRNRVDLTLAASPAEGGSVAGGGSYDSGVAATIAAIPAENWMFTGWTGTGVADPFNPDTTVIVDAAKTVTAGFARIRHSLTVTASPVEAGIVTGEGMFDQGSLQPISAIPASGWHFTGWSGPGVVDPASASTAVLMDSQKSVSAMFVSDYDLWIQGHGLAGEDALASSDPDADGMINETEFAFGFDPGDPNSRLKLSIGYDAAGLLRFTINKVIPTGVFTIEWSDTPGGAWENRMNIPVSSEAVDFDVFPPVSGDRCFYRVRHTAAAAGQ